jgi:Fe-S-cluster containining protein
MDKYYGRMAYDGKGWELDDRKRTPCPFIGTDSDGRIACDIYPVRPLNCELFPFETTGSLICPVAVQVIEIMKREQL